MAGSSVICHCLQMVRPHILSLKADTSSRMDVDNGDRQLLLDLNENAFGHNIVGPKGSAQDIRPPEDTDLLMCLRDLNRYPAASVQFDDSVELKNLFCDFRNRHNGSIIRPANVCFSAGLDDIIDIIIRCLCQPGCDSILTCPPHYHMYSKSAMINDVSVVTVELDASNKFRPRIAAIQDKFRNSKGIKVCFICSPGNPTGYLIPITDITRLLEDQNWKGVLVVDESYIDFATGPVSAITLLRQYPRLIVLQSLSKAWGLANVRVGFMIACEHLIRVLENVKKPYAVSGVSIALAKAAFRPASLTLLERNLQALRVQKERLSRELTMITGIGRIRGGPDANFVLFEVLNTDQEGRQPCNAVARRVSARLAQENILVRFKGYEYGCHGCIRVTVGTSSEVSRFLKQLSLTMQKSVWQSAKI